MKRKTISFILALVLCAGLIAPVNAAAFDAVQSMEASVWTSINTSAEYQIPGAVVIQDNGDLWMYLMGISKHELVGSQKILTNVIAVTDSSTLLDAPNRSYSVLALKSDGTLWLCYGGLGLSWNDRPTNTDERISKTYFGAIQIDSNVAQISANCYLKKNGEMYLASFPSGLAQEPKLDITLNAKDVISISGVSYITSDHIFHLSSTSSQTYSGFQSLSEYVSESTANVTFAIDDKGDLYSFGYSEYGEAGGGFSSISGKSFVGDAAYMSNSFVLRDVSNLYFTSGCVYARDASGQLWQWGDASTPVKWNNDIPIVSENDKISWSPRKSTLTQPKYTKIQAIEISENGTLSFGYHNDIYDYGLVQFPLKLANVLGSGSTTSPSAPAQPPALTAKPTSSTVLVDGWQVAFDAYNISGNNYFKLRDLAFALNGSEKQFEVGWDGANNAISLTSGKEYTVLGSEMTGKGPGDKTPTPTSSKIYLDGKEVTLTAYNIEGNNYFKLRDIGQVFNFGVDWDGAKNTIVIDTSKGYTPD